MSANILGPRSGRRVGGGKVVLHQPAIDLFFRSTFGPIGMNMAIRADRVLAAARRDVGVAKPDPLGRPSERAPGTLRDSLTMQPIPGIKGPAVRVGSADPIARLHHEGTPPHLIFPRRQGGRLLFAAADGSRIFARQVSHPGTEPNPYLVKNLPLALI